MPQHTPGPWMITQYPALAPMVYAEPTAGEMRPICQGHSPSEAEDAANARLIAAAPDLLMLAKQYASECGECNGTGSVYAGEESNDHGVLGIEIVQVSESCDQCAAIRRVIAKAESSC